MAKKTATIDLTINVKDYGQLIINGSTTGMKEAKKLAKKFRKVMKKLEDKRITFIQEDGKMDVSESPFQWARCSILETPTKKDKEKEPPLQIDKTHASDPKDNPMSYAVSEDFNSD